jgi:hypothetical protein
VVGGIAGLIIGLLIGWLLIGWVLWPVQYVGDAYTYELNEADKLDYLAALVDSYNLTGRLDVVQQRLNRWTTEEKVGGLARLFAGYQVEGRMPEAERVTDLAGELQRAEGWDLEVVRQEATAVAQKYADEGAQAKAAAVTVFAGEMGATGVATPIASPAPTAVGTEAEVPALGNVGLLVRVCGVLLLLIVLVLAVLILRSRGRRPRGRAVVREPEAQIEPLRPSGPQPLLQKMSSYKLGMDNFDESFAIETEDDEWLGECGMGISESAGDGTPRRVAAFEVWLFDKINTRTVTKVLVSDFANSNEMLRNKLSTRGEPVLATPGQSFTLETPALRVEARVAEMAYGAGTPAFGYFENLKVSLSVYRKTETEASGEVA